MTILQHPDINVGPASYKHLKSDELLVTKIFWTLQGEGPFAGTPAIFIRLAGCNRGDKQTMGCGFCDTAFYFAKGRPMTFSQIISRFDSIVSKTAAGVPPEKKHTNPYGTKKPLVVVTGGEPMMQNNLTLFMEALWRAHFYKVQIESNGDRLAAGFLDEQHENACLVVSPKVVKGKYPLLKDAVWERVTVLKFIISADPESPYYDVPSYAFDFPGIRHSGNEVFLSPLTVYRKEHNPGVPVSLWNRDLIDQEATALNYKRAAGLALRHGFRVSVQQHLLFGVE